MKKQEDEVIVTFNGKTHTLNELVKMETAATNKDRYWQDEADHHETVYEKSVETKLPRFSKKPKKLFKSKHRLSKNLFPSFSKSFWIPLLSAIVVGLGLGFTVLVFFSHNSIKDNSTTPSANPQQAQSVSHPAERIVGADLSLSTQVVQTAAVSSAQQAKDIEKQMSSIGIPAVTSKAKDNSYTYVFIGIAITKDNAKQLGDIYQGQGANVYIKPWTVESSHVVLPDQALYQIVKSERDLLAKLIAASSELMVSHTVTPTLQQELNKNAITIKQSMNKEPKNIQSFVSQMDSVNNLMKVAIKNPTPGNKRLIQQKVLVAMVSYQQLLTSYNQ